MFIILGDDNRWRRRFPVIILLLIGINFYVWYLQLTKGDAFTYGFSVIPVEIARGTDIVRSHVAFISGERVTIPGAPGPHPIQLTLLTSMFMHGSWLHLLGNMLYLWVFGDQIEELLGRIRFLICYLLAGVAGALTQVAIAPQSYIPSLGASGAIAGVLGAYLLYFPRNGVRVLVFTSVVTLPAYLVLGSWIVFQLLAHTSPQLGDSSIAYGAHIGGFFSGLLLSVWLRRR